MKLFGRCVIHRFGEWKIVERGSLIGPTAPAGTKGEIGNYLIQERVCNDCKFVEVESRRIYVA